MESPGNDTARYPNHSWKWSLRYRIGIVNATLTASRSRNISGVCPECLS